MDSYRIRQYFVRQFTCRTIHTGVYVWAWYIKSVEFYAHAGFDILKFAAVDKNRVNSIHDAPPEVALELALSVDTPESEAIFISCTAFNGASEVIEELEQKTGKPVVTSNQATFWWCMREMSITDAIPWRWNPDG